MAAGSLQSDTHAVLRKYWGYEAFRPLQEAIIDSLLAGRDIAAVLPTGGGKSLCYQLPAVLLEHPGIVISPLIALMQDQIAQLGQMGIAAAALNSAMPYPEQMQVRRLVQQNRLRLLYLSPERLAREDTVDWLRQVQASFFAIDEAHCISEWGHEFRPEYRQLGRLRDLFPGTPIAAFTASATRVVRHDILLQLKLREPATFIRSFYRSNLRYYVRQCDNNTHERLLMKALRAYAGQNVIVYVPTIAAVSETVDTLAQGGISALGYHGQMEPAERKRNQDRWTNGEPPVMVSTIAFGLGINKADVRAVIHTSLPKSIEQYYQEAGRAGRDGLPADCLLLWRRKDKGLLAYFIEKLTDPGEQRRAWQRYRDITEFAESETCRHLRFSNHFGETPKWAACNHCDNCGWKPEWLETGRMPVPLVASPLSPVAAEGDAHLFQYLRQWRLELARSLKLPPFVVLTDATLQDLCRKQPRTREELLQVNGIGEYKAEVYGARILRALAAFAGTTAPPPEPSMPAEAGPAPPVPRPKREISEALAEEVLALIAEGLSLEAMAARRGVARNTIVSHVAALLESGRAELPGTWIPPERRQRIETAAAQAGLEYLKPIRDRLSGDAPHDDFSYDDIRLVVSVLRWRARGPSGG